MATSGEKAFACNPAEHDGGKAAGQQGGHCGSQDPGRAGSRQAKKLLAASDRAR